MSNQLSWNKTFIDIAFLIAKHSKAKRRQVGAILVKDNRIISIGYNGTISGFDNCCEDEHGETKKEVIHAEINCIAKCAKSNENCNNATLYITFSPCIECAKILIQSGITNVYYKDQHSDILGIELLQKAFVNIYQII